MDLDDGSYCNGAYEGGRNMRVAVETVCNAKDCRFHFFVAGDIAMGEDVIYNYGDFAISSVWEDFGLYIIKIYHGGRVQCNYDIIHNMPQC